MVATVRTYSGSGGLVDALVENESSVRELLVGIAGFKAYYMIRCDDGGAVSVSVFDDQSGVDESNRAAAGWISENLPGLGISPPQVSSGEVALAF